MGGNWIRKIIWIGRKKNCKGCDFTYSFHCKCRFYTLFFFTHYFFKDYTNTEVTANQIPSYVIDFNNSKKFVSELDNLHVKTYYGFPFYNSDRPSNNIEFLECIKRPNPHKISRLEEKYQPSIPTQITSGSAAYIIPEDQVDNYNYLESLPSKILRVNGQNYVVFYKGN